MSTSYTIHPHGSRTRLSFKADRPFAPDNANSVQLTFSSPEPRATYDFQTIDQSIILFGMNAVDAELLSLIGLLDDEHRAALLPAARHALDDQTADNVIALEEAQTDA